MIYKVLLSLAIICLLHWRKLIFSYGFTLDYFHWFSLTNTAKSKISENKNSTMSLNDALLPKYVSDSCYASLTPIYIDIFQVPPSSDSFPCNNYEQRLTSDHNTNSLRRPNRLNQAVYSHKST